MCQKGFCQKVLNLLEIICGWVNMSTKQSKTLQVLVQRYEGSSSTKKNSGVVLRHWKSLEDEVDSAPRFMSPNREEKTLTLKQSTITEMTVEEPLYAAVVKKNSVHLRDKTSMVTKGQRSSSTRRSMNNISFSFPPFNSFYNLTVSIWVKVWWYYPFSRRGLFGGDLVKSLLQKNRKEVKQIRQIVQGKAT